MANDTATVTQTVNTVTVEPPTPSSLTVSSTSGGALSLTESTASLTAVNVSPLSASLTIESEFATKESPNFTGTPTAPTASAGTSTTQIATTAFVGSAIAVENSLVEMDDVTLTSLSDNELLQYDTTTSKWLNQTLAEAGVASTTSLTSHTGNTSNPHSVTAAQVSLGNVTNESKATMFTNPVFTGNPTAPTQVAGNNSTRVATTEYVNSAISLENSLVEMDDVVISSVGNSELLQYNSGLARWINTTFAEAGVAPVVSPTFTGTPLAPTASAATNTTQLATTAYVTTAVSNLVDSSPAALNTLNELAAALNDDASFSTTVTNSIATKLPLAGGTMSGSIVMPVNGTVDGRDLSVDGAKLDGIADSANNYVLPASTSSALGGIKLGYTTNNKQYPVDIDSSSKAFVAVPWTDTQLTASQILTSIKTVDGASSGLDADLLDGQHGSYYGTASAVAAKLPLAGGTMSGPILHSAGSDSAPSISWAGDPDTGIYHYGANSFAFATSGALRGQFQSGGKLKLWGGLELDGNTALVKTTLTVGVDGTGHDVTFHSATASRAMLWDASAKALKLDDLVTFAVGSSDDLQVYHTTHSYIENTTNNLYINNLATGADTIFKCDNDSGTSTELMRLDGSATSINLSAPLVFKNSGDTTGYATVGLSSSNYTINAYGSGGWRNNAFVIDGDTGNVSISGLTSITAGGTSSPVGINGLHLMYDSSSSTAWIKAEHNGTSNRHLGFNAASYTFNTGISTFNNDIRLPNNKKLVFGDNQKYRIDYDSSGFAYHQNLTGHTYYYNSEDNKDFVFQTHSGGSINTILRLDASHPQAVISGNIEAKRGTNSTKLKLYETYTDASNYERSFFRHASSFAEIGTEAAGTGTASGLKFYTAGSPRMTVLSDGKVGIGTDAPSQLLDIHSVGGSNNGYMSVRHLEGKASNSNAYGPLYINYLSNNNIFLASGGGNVGIGTTTVPHTLSVKGTISRLNSSGIQIINLGSSSDHGQLTINNSGGTTRVALNSSGADSYINAGNFGIGTTSPSTKLDVNGVITSTGGNSTNWNTAYTYSQVSHLPLAGGDMTGPTVHNDSVHSFWGNSNDLDIYHNPALGSFISDRGAGDLFITTNQAVIFQKYQTSEVMAKMVPDGAVELYHDNVKKFETTSAGVAVTGGLTVDGSAQAGEVRFTRDGINSSTYTMLCTVNGDRLASIINMTITGTSNSVVLGSAFEIIVNHSQDIHVRSTSSDYKEATIRITSTDNEDYSIELKHNGSTTTQVEVCIFPQAGETITPTTTDPNYTGAEYEHTATEGWRYGGEDGNVESSNVIVDGKVGIGTTSPAEKLDVTGVIKFSGGYVLDSAHSLRLDSASGQPVTISVADSEKFRVHSDGNVGIGTTSPAQKLDVVGRIRSSYNSGDYFEIGSSDNGGFVVGKSGGTEIVNIRTYGDSFFNGGNFGIGTTSPSYRLSVHKDLGSSGTLAEFKNSNSTYSQQVWLNFDSNKDVTWHQGSSNGGVTFDVGARGHAFQINGTEAANIDATGLNVTGVIKFLGGYVLDSVHSIRLDSASGQPVTISVADSEKFRVHSDGNVGIGTNAPAEELHIYSSDHARLRVEGNQNTRFADLQLKNADQMWVVRLEGTSLDFAIRDDTHASEPFRIKESTSTGANDSAIVIDGDGKVGIGAFTPSHKLHVSGDARIEGDLTVNGDFTIVDTNTSTTEQFSITNDGTGPALIVNQTGAQPIVDFKDDGTSVFNILNGGDIVMTGDLRLPDGGASTPALTFSGDTDTGIWRSGSGASALIRFSTAGISRGHFNSAGITSSANVYCGTNHEFRNYSGEWKGTTGVTGNGFRFINSVDGTALTVTSTGDMTPAGSLRLPDGTGGSPSLTFSSGLDTGFYRSDYTSSPQKDQINASIDGNGKFKINEAGIWSVSGNIYLANGRHYRTFQEWSAQTGGSGYGFKFRNTADSVDCLVVSATGNLTPAGVILAQNGSPSAPSITTVSDTNTGLYAFDSDRLGVTAGGACRMVIGSTGVGVGSVNPTSPFHLTAVAVGQTGTAVTTMTKSIAATTIGAKLSFTGGSNTSNNIIGGLSMGNTGEEYAGMYAIDGGSSASTHLAFFTGNSTATTEAIRILSDGKVGIGTTSVNAGIGLQVQNGDFYVYSGNIKADNINAGYYASTRDLELQGGVSAGVKLMSGATTVLQTKSDGKVGIGITAPATIFHAKDASVDNGLVKLRVEGGSTSGYGELGVQSGYVRLLSNGTLTLAQSPSSTYIYTGAKTHALNASEIRSAGNFTAENGTTATKLELYETYTDASNYERGTIKFDSSFMVIGTDDLGTGTASGIKLQTDSTDRLTITAAGQVGIGTTTAPHTLSVKGTISRLNSSGIQIVNVISSADHGQVQVLNSSGTERALINSNGNSFFTGGNLGIGTSSPSSPLSVVGAARIDGSSGDGVLTIANSAGSQSLRIDQNSLRTTTNNNLTFLTNGNSNSLVLEQANNRVGIGTASPATKLDVNGGVNGTHLTLSGTAGRGLTIGSTNGSGQNDAEVIYNAADTESSAYHSKHIFQLGGSEKFKIYNDSGQGKVRFTANIFAYTAHDQIADFYSTDTTGYIRVRDSNDSTYLASDNTMGSFGGNAGAHANNLNINLTTGDVGIGTVTPDEKLDVSGNLKVGQSASNGHRIGRKDYSITHTFTTGLTVTLADHTACHVKVFISGDWANHSSFAYVGEFFIQNSGNGYNEPGIILTEHDNLKTDGILSKIVDGTGDSFTIQFRANTSSSTSVSGRLCYHVMGDSTAVA